MFDKDVLKSLKRITDLIVRNVIDTIWIFSGADTTVPIARWSQTLILLPQRQRLLRAVYTSADVYVISGQACDRKITSCWSGSKDEVLPNVLSKIINMLFGWHVPKHIYRFSLFRESSLTINTGRILNTFKPKYSTLWFDKYSKLWKIF